MPTTAFITGITGQDGLYLAELLSQKKYSVYGLVHGQNNPKAAAVEALVPGVRLIEGDMTDLSSLIRALKKAAPDEVYNLGGWTSVGGSFSEPLVTANANALGALNILEALRLNGQADKTRFLQASSSEMFGKVAQKIQNEQTPFHPRSPYGISKTFAHYTTVNYRESYGMFACSAILFNHESPRRGHEFVTRKITTGVARIKLGLQDGLTLGNLDAQRDWGFAGDYVRGMWLMLQQDAPDDFVFATGITHSIRDLLEVAFDAAGLGNWQPYVGIDEKFLRPAEVEYVKGDAQKARKVLGWKPKVKFEELVAMMVKSDLEHEARHLAKSD